MIRNGSSCSGRDGSGWGGAAGAGAGGYGTPVTVYSATKELAEEARAMAGDKIEPVAAGLDGSNQEVPRGWLPYRLASDAIRFTGLEDSEFSLPRPLVETEV